MRTDRDGMSELRLRSGGEPISAIRDREQGEEGRLTDRESSSGSAVRDRRHTCELRLVDVPWGGRTLGTLLIEEREVVGLGHRLGRDGPAHERAGESAQLIAYIRGENRVRT